MKIKAKIIFSIFISIIILISGIALGSVYIRPSDIFSIIAANLFGSELPEGISQASLSIIWNLRLPRAVLAYIAGCALAVSGAVMQSVLRNPLASSYTLGVSSGASLGAGFVILYGLALPFGILKLFTLPLAGFIFGLITILFVIAISSRFDSNLGNNTIILTGMVFSLFTNAIITLISALAREQMQRLLFWQMGSFAMKDWSTVYILALVASLLILFILRYHRELDILTFGEDQASTIGINLRKTKWMLLITAAALTGSAISFVGIIGFVDLIAPHIVRKLYGSSHRLVIPMSAVFGGSFMVICDLAARTVVSPQELPVGAVTALVGAPFFTYVYFSKRAR